MAIFTADQATTAVTLYNQSQTQSSLDSLVAEYQQIFDTIKIASSAGATSIDLKITKYDYNRVKYLLIDNGYILSTLPEDQILQDDRQVTYSITISWSASFVETLVGISPSLFTVTVGVYTAISLVPQGGRAPYTWRITAGGLPSGLAFQSLSRVASLDITGTATNLGSGSFNYTLLDSSGQSYSANVTWSVTASNTVYLGSTAVDLNRVSGALTLADVSITGNAATSDQAVAATRADQAGRLSDPTTGSVVQTVGTGTWIIQPAFDSTPDQNEILLTAGASSNYPRSTLEVMGSQVRMLSYRQVGQNSQTVGLTVSGTDQTISLAGDTTVGNGLNTHTVNGTVYVTGTATFTNTINGSISGNAATVTNGVYTNQSYSNPNWIASLDVSKVSGAVSTGGTYTDPSWLTISKAKVGLSNVDNISVATILNNTALTGTTTINQGTVTTVGTSTTSLVNKNYVDRQVLFNLAVGIWG